jgi:Zn-dependent protease with chaperone function
MWKNKSMAVLGLGLFLAMVLCVQMGLYLVNILYGPAVFDNIFQFCIRIFKKNTVEYYIVLLLVNTYVAYTIWIFLKKVIQQAINTNRLKKKIAFLTNWKITDEMNKSFNRSKEDIVVINSRNLVALTFGFRKPTIVLSTNLIDMLDQTELEAVILHETAHQKYYDPLKVFVLQTISEVMWYIPLAIWAHKNFRIMIELVADEYAITRMGSELGLGSALLKLIKTHLAIKTPPLLVPFADGTVDYRLKQLIEPQHTLPVKLQSKSIIISVNVMILLMIVMVIV